MVSLESAYGTMEDDEHQKQDHHDTIKMAVTESPTSTTTTTTTNTTSSSSSNSSSTSCSNSTSTSKDNETNNIPEETTWKGKKPPHKASNDENWMAIQKTKGRQENEGEDGIGLSDFRLLKKLGRGDIGSVYLVELKGTECLFAMKVMDKGSLAGRKKMLRAKTEREILGLLDHPFLPTLYATFETQQFSCLVMEYCSGGDLHTFRQRQANKRFCEDVVRFYASEVLLALEYLHMMGVIYRDLKPENVLVREDGHIMLTDFDLSLRCVVRPTLVKPAQLDLGTSCRIPALCVKPPACIVRECVIPACIPPTCFMPGLFSHRFRKSRKPSSNNDVHPRHVTLSLLPELVAEPTSARSMSFVGTHEYLAPEIIRGEGHGSSVDWWTFGIFLYELLHGKTPFKGLGNHATLANVAGQPLKFPDSPSISSAAKDLIKSLLAKEPQHRLGFRRGATEIKQHPFFDGVNWALVRSNSPPQVPKPTHIDTGPVKQVNPPDNDSKPNDVKKVDFDVY